jgi:hypothetical protein
LVAQSPAYFNNVKVGGGYEDPPGVGTTLTNTGDGYFRGDLIVDGNITGGGINVDLEAAFASPYPLGVTVPNSVAATTLSASSLSLVTPLADAYVANTLTLTAGSVAASIITGSITDAQVADALTVTGYMQDTDIDTFAELQSWVADKTLLNAEDDLPWADADVADILTIGAGSTIDPSLLPTTDLASPGPIGGTTPSTAVFDPTVTVSGDAGTIALSGDLQAIVYDRAAPNTANYFRWTTGEYMMFENTAGTDVFYLGDSAVTAYQAFSAQSTIASFGVNDTTYAQLRLYGNSTTTGSQVLWYQSADEDGTIDYFVAQPNNTYWMLGPSTNTNLIQLYETEMLCEYDFTANDDLNVGDDIVYIGAGEFDINNPADTNMDLVSAGQLRFWTDSDNDDSNTSDFIWFKDASTVVMTFDTSVPELNIVGSVDISTGSTYQINGTQIAATNLSDGANIAHINAVETLSADWVNTANPWADNEVSNTLTSSIFVGSGSTTNAVDLATAEVAGRLNADMLIADTDSATLDASGEVSLTSFIVKITSYSGTSDTLETFDIGTSNLSMPFVLLRPAVGHTITVNDGGAINSCFDLNSDFTMVDTDGDCLLIMQDPYGGAWYMEVMRRDS